MDQVGHSLTLPALVAYIVVESVHSGSYQAELEAEDLLLVVGQLKKLWNYDRWPAFLRACRKDYASQSDVAYGFS